MVSSTTSRTEAKNTRPQTGQRHIFSTPEAQARAQAGRRAKVAARRASALRRDFTEAGWWMRLASARALTLPPWGEPCTTGQMERWLHKVGMTIPEYFRLSGFTQLGEFARVNPGWPMRAWAGLVLEAGVQRNQELTEQDRPG